MLIRCVVLFLIVTRSAWADFSPETLFGVASQDNKMAVLHPDQAFNCGAESVSATNITVRCKIAKHHYLYRDKFQFRLEGVAKSRIDEISIPMGQIKQDPEFGAVSVFHNGVDIAVRLQHHSMPPPDMVRLMLAYQGCSEAGVCYSPVQKQLTVNLTRGAPPPAPKGEDVLFTGQSFGLVLLSFLGFGVLLSLTPCVYPMIPILAALILQSSHSRKTARAFGLAVVFVLGSGVAYAFMGVMASFSGQLVSTLLQTPWVLGISASVFLIMALSMLDVCELPLNIVSSRVIQLSNRFQNGHFAGVFVAGLLSALIVSPCVTPPLAGVLVYIANTHNLLLGGAALFALAIGMGVPLLMTGASAQFLLPKSGHWLKVIRSGLGVVMLIMAIMIIRPVIPGWVLGMLWVALGVFVILGTSMNKFLGHLWVARIAKISGVLFIGYGLLLLGAGFARQHNQSGWWSGVWSRALLATASREVSFQRVDSVQDLQQQLMKSGGKLVMLDFYADWCIACQEYEWETFRDARVVQALDKVVKLKADVSVNNAENAALLKQFQLFGPPAILFFDDQGQEMTHYRIVGYQKPDTFLASLRRVVGARQGR